MALILVKRNRFAADIFPKEELGYQYLSQICQNNRIFKVRPWEPKFGAKKRGNFY